MISIQHLVEHTERYQAELQKRFKNPELAIQAKQEYTSWKEKQQELDILRQQKNEFNNLVVTLSGAEKESKIAQMKQVSDEIKTLEEEVKELRQQLDATVAKIPNLTWSNVPIGRSDEDNPVVGSWGDKPEFSFDIKPYYKLPVYEKFVSQKEGVKVMGSRGFYMRGDMALFQKVLFEYAEEVILKHGLELFYVPLMLNEKTMTEIGNLPDFDGQLYEVKIDDDKTYYLIPSSEQSLMGYFSGQNVGTLQQPILVAANTTCFRKEAGSYGKDQQGILRVHQFQKIEMDALCRPEDNDKVFDLFAKINEEIYSSLGLHFRAVEVCTGDMPAKHYRQVDYEAWFPGEGKYREICSNGSASDYQNRGLKISYTNDNGEQDMPWGLNCTGVTFRTGLALLEQNQQEDGSVKLPEVLAKRIGKDILK